MGKLLFVFFVLGLAASSPLPENETEMVEVSNRLVPSPRCSDARTTTPMKVVCYYPNWVYYRKGDGKYTVEDIDTSLCTHIVYSFVILDGEKHIIKAHDTWLDIDRSGSRGWNLGNFRKFTALKKTNPNAKYMLALGGWNDSKMPNIQSFWPLPLKLIILLRKQLCSSKNMVLMVLILITNIPAMMDMVAMPPILTNLASLYFAKSLAKHFRQIALS